jgi:homoserine dehydrogenase
VFASHNVSIQTVRQTGTGDKAELILMTHSSTESALAATVKDLGKLEAVSDVSSVLRVEGVN